MNLIEYPDRDMMMIDVANAIAGDLTNDLLHEDMVSFAVPGGTTPGPVFSALSAVNLHWDRVNVMLGDERWVPEDSDRSNTALLKKTLLVDRAAEATFIPFYRKGLTPDQAAPAISEAVSQHLPLSVLLLGMGADMHTASLFPGAAELPAALAHNAPAVLPITQPGTGEVRVTLTAPVLEGALSTHILITGADKREALERARHLDALEAPVRRVLSGATIHWAL